MSKKRNLLGNLGVDTNEPKGETTNPSDKPAVRRRKTSSERESPDLEALDGGKPDKAESAPESPEKAPTDSTPDAKEPKTPNPVAAKTRIQIYVDADLGERFREMVQVMAHQYPGPSEAGADALEVWMKANKKEFERLKEVLGEQPQKRFKPGRRAS